MDVLSSMQKAIDFIEENICEDLSAEAIATHVYLSPFYFQRLFSIVCGLTLGEYIRNRRLSSAGIEVEMTNEKIIDIALKYHYESPESFSRAFTRFHGVSPMMARRHKGKINSFAKISIESILSGGNITMQKLRERGYAVKENGPIYYTKNMDRTAKWFEEVLGWYAGIDQRNEITEQTWGGKECVVTTIDGGSMRFFQLDD